MINIRNYKGRILLLFTVLFIIPLFLLPPIKQDQQYHEFADQRTIIGIANFLNTISNLPFVLLGLISIYSYLKSKVEEGLFIADIIFFISVIGIGLGSSYYHLNPNNYTLIYDRLPMTLAFMSFLSI